MLGNPVCFRIGPLPVHWYGLFLAAGFLAALATWVRLGRGERRDMAFCTDLLLWIMVAGIVGARLAYVISDLPEYLKNPVSILRVDQGGLIYYGGFLSSAAAVAVFARKHKVSALRLGDLVVTALPLAHALGRIGCFVNGCCYGKPWDGPLGVSYPAESAPWWGQVYAQLITRYSPRSLPVHPVQLYEAAFNVALYAFLVFAYKQRWKDGVVVALYAILYPAWRLWVETLRGDERMQRMGLDVAQWLSLLFMLGGVGLALYLRKRRNAAD